VPKNKSVQRLNMANGKPVGRRYAKINDAAAYLGCNAFTIRSMIDKGQIHAYRYGTRLIRVDLNELDAFMAGENHGVA
jgi:excisionase family DNA binding protein